MTTELAYRSAAELAGLIRARSVSPVELVHAYLARIDRSSDGCGPTSPYPGARARRGARAPSRARRAAAPVGPLHGVPFAVKDQFDDARVRTTSGSRILADHVPAEDATVVARLPRRAASCSAS